MAVAMLRSPKIELQIAMAGVADQDTATQMLATSPMTTSAGCAGRAEG
jgi:hypothetical protein